MKITTHSILPTIIVSSLISSLALPMTAQASKNINDQLSVYGDLRIRYESDSDSHKSSGALRSDRDRARYRLRLGAKYKPTSNIEAGARLRSGSDGSQQSPHITFQDFNNNNEGDSDFNFDKWYIKGKTTSASGWIGRNGYPLWKQNEMFWDDDVTVAGVGGKYKLNNKLSLRGGYFKLPDGMDDFSGDVVLAQAVYAAKLGGSKLTLAGSANIINGESGSKNLLSGNGDRDYSILVGSAQLKNQLGGIPLTLGLDIIHNAEDYSATSTDAYTAAHHNETDGHVISAKLGKLKEKGDWLVGVYYADIDALAVNASYAQDDWMRWGNATQTRSSDFKGTELRGAVAVQKNINLVTRFYDVEAKNNGKEDGNRFRVDLNIKF